MNGVASDRTDQELVEAARAGNLGAFEELVRRHERFVFGAALRIVKNRVVAEDVAQETFFAAWKAIGTFRGDAQVRSWLYRIATNRALNAVTRQREFATEETYIDHPRTASAEEEAIRRVGVEELGSAVAQLPDALRQVFILREEQGLSYEEISARLGVPLNTVRTRLRRARLAVADHLEEWR